MKQQLQKVRLLSDIHPHDFNALARVTIGKNYDKGDYICHEGERAVNFYWVTSGKVKLVKHTTFGKDVILEICTAGETFLLESLMDGSEHPVSAIAAEPTSILQLERITLLRIMDQNPKMARAFLREMSSRNRVLIDQIQELSVGKVDYRIANMVLKLGQKIGEEDASGQVKMDISLSRQDIADLTGTTIETAIRTMSRLAKQEVLRTTRDSILILDRDKLEDIAAGF